MTSPWTLAPTEVLVVDRAGKVTVVSEGKALHGRPIVACVVGFDVSAAYLSREVAHRLAHGVRFTRLRAPG